ncbi:MAG: preprotein translocase subunit YajC [Alphaproteobacteria bacterium]|nr:preprotein translocase subunit YajC [Alphaproteobacteria bacterium]MCY4318743.1 preprotein translocase subunit YajC [Alphaproteobacteria bacterium]
MLISPAYAQSGGGGDMLTGLLPIILIFVVFYFLLIRPQQKKAKAHRELVAALRRGDRVVTAGGIMGVVARVNNEHEVLVEIAEGVRVRMVRSQITDVLSKPNPAAAAPANDGGRPAGGLGGLFGRFGKGN